MKQSILVKIFFSLSMFFTFFFVFSSTSIQATAVCPTGSICRYDGVALSAPGFVCRPPGQAESDPYVTNCCPSNTVMSGTSCVSSCPAGQHPLNGKCVPGLQCTAGQCIGYPNQTVFEPNSTCRSSASGSDYGKCYVCDSSGNWKTSDTACGTTPTAPTVPAPGAPAVGSCDGCMNEGSCNMRKGSFTKQTTGTCAPQGGYCNGTTFCGGGGTSATPIPLNKACGDKCTSNADCRNPSGNGSPVACIQGTCQNTMCALGMTIPGGNCSCGANTRKCGQSCSGTVGLCGPGQGSCTYVNPPQHWYTGQPDCAWGSSAYCVSNKNGYTNPVCITGDAPGGRYLVAPNGAARGLTTEDMQKSCQVCGNGEIEIGEQCDDGTKNGTPGSNCTVGTCKKVTCGMTCTTDASCGATQHVVKFVLRKTTATSTMGIDYVLDKGVYAEASTATFRGAGPGSFVTDSSAHLGTFVLIDSIGSREEYSTYSPEVTVRLAGGANRGIVDVYIDNVKKQSITTLATSAGWVDTVIPVVPTNQYTCVKTGATSACRLTVNPGSSICEIPPATPTPAPTAPPLACVMSPTITSTGNAAAWKIGDKITFNVGAATSAGLPINSKIRYEGQVSVYRGTTQVSTMDLTPINASAAQFMPMTVNAVNATYYYRFRYCVMNAENVETCSAWGNWAAPTGV